MPTLPQRVIDIALALREQVALPASLQPTQEEQDRCRAFVRMVASQMAWEFGPAWGVKRAGEGRPQGQSQIAYRDGETLGGWRILDGDGSETGMVNGIIPNPPWQSFEGQVFIPVEPLNHLRVGRDTTDSNQAGAAKEPEPQPDQTAVALPEILVALHDLTGALSVLDESVRVLTARVQELRAGGLKLRF